jgi:hypothetical protein
MICTPILFSFQVEVERGLSFDDALDKLNTDLCPGEGFYTSKRVRWGGGVQSSTSTMGVSECSDVGGLGYANENDLPRWEVLFN